MTNPALQYTVERLLALYAAAIDDDRLEEWPRFFTERCRYQIISRENYLKKLPVGIFFADSRAMLEANIYEAQHYRHILSPSLVLEAGAGFARVQTNYQVIRIMHDGATMLF